MVRHLWIRRLTQAASLYVIGTFSYYGIFRCPFAVPYVSCENCPVLQCPGRKIWLPVWIAILASALAFGRAFCSHACPGGMVAELFSRVSLLRGKVRGMADRVLSSGKYLALMACIYVFWFMHNPRWAVPIRTGGFTESTMLTFEHAFPLWFARTGIVLGALALGLVIPHFWCRYLCPTGAALRLAGFRPLFRYFMSKDCTDCGVCNRKCDLETRPAKHNCTNCGDCAGKCPAGAIKLGR